MKREIIPFTQDGEEIGRGSIIWENGLCRIEITADGGTVCK